MVNDPLATIATRTRPTAPNFGTPQRDRSRHAATAQSRNHAGGYVFTAHPLTRLHRFLTLGVDGPTYSTSATALAEDNARIVFAFANSEVEDFPESHRALVDLIVEISTSGRAPRQNPVLFALAVAASNGSDAERRYALQQLPLVARTATHLFQFLGYAQNFRGWGPAFTKYVAAWYTDTDADSLAYQMVKYRSRYDWTHRDVLRKAHPRTTHPASRALFDWTCGRTPDDVTALPRIVQGFIKSTDPATTVASRRALITEYRLPWETLPDESLTDAKTWQALFDANAVPLTALIRQLPRLTNLGVLSPGAHHSVLRAVVDRLGDGEYLRRSRVHPINLLVALKTYASGVSARGDSTWTPVQQVIDALDRAFYLSFGNVTPTGKRIRFACDVSGSMDAAVSGLPLTCREAVAALTLVSASTETDYDIVKFTCGPSLPNAGFYSRVGYPRNSGLTPMGISPRMRLDDVMRVAKDADWGGTDCALPMVDATEKNLAFDAFVILTDNDTWAGSIHPFEALQRYRAKSGIHDARLIVVSMTATRFSIADPTDPGMLDISGFDATVPQVISDFVRG